MYHGSTILMRLWPLCGLLFFFEPRNTNSPGIEDDFVRIFDGKTLNGWEGDSTYWSVKNGHIVGEVRPTTLLKRNSFLIWRGGTTKDFELKVDYLISKEGNSGINYRSKELKDLRYALRGYQADLDGANQYTGQNYEERARCIVAARGQQVILPEVEGAIEANVKDNRWLASKVMSSANSDSLTGFIHNDWNEYHLIVKGNHMQHYVNGVLMSDVTDEDKVNRTFEGLLGVQVHVGPPMKVEYRNFRIKALN